MMESSGDLANILVLTALIFTGSIGWLLVRGGTLVPVKEPLSRLRRKMSR